jgi:hypothetical protein
VLGGRRREGKRWRARGVPWPGGRRWIYDVHARPRRTVLRWNVLRRMAREDGAREDGATEDGATEDGAKEDGAAVVAVSGTHGLGGPCYGRRCYEDGATEVGATEDGATEVAVIGTHGLGGPCYGGWLRRTVLRWMVQRWVGASTKKPAKHKGLRVSDGCRFSS